MRRYLGTYLLKILLVGVGLMNASLTAHLLGPGGRGDIALTNSTLGVAGLFLLFGLPLASTTLLQRSGAPRAQILRENFWFCLAVGVGTGTLAGLVAGLGHRGPVAYLLSLWIPLHLLFISGGQLLFAIDRPLLSSGLDLLVRLVWLICLGGSLVVGLTLDSLWALLLLFGAHVPTTITSWAVLFRSTRGDPVEPSVTTASALKGHAPYVMRLWVAGLLNTLVLNLDVLLIGGLLPRADVGLYNAAATVANLLLLLPQTVCPLLLNEAARFATFEEQLAPVRRRLLPCLAVCLLVAAFLALATRPLVLRFFGEAFLTAVPVTYILLGAVVCMAMAQIAGIPLCAAGQPGALLALQLGAVGVNLVGNLLTVPRYGLVGAAWVSFLSYGFWLLNTVVCLVYYRRYPDRLPRPGAA